MSDTDMAPAIDTEIPVDSIPAGDETLSLRDAANKVADFRYKRDAKDKDEPAAPDAAAKAEESVEPDASPPEEETTGDKTETPEPEEIPPIEPPRSWTKEEKEEFASYPREAQEKIARREQDRESALRRGQNETAEQRKALEAERQKVDQARQQYEQALPQLLQTLQEQQQGEFSDIKTMSDVEKLAREDWPRYALWDAQQKKIAAVSQEMNLARERQTQEFRTQWSEFANKEDALFLDKAPEMSNKETAQKVADASVTLLRNLGFSDADLTKAWNGEASVSLRDHRIQLLIRDAAKYQSAKVETPKKAVKVVPPVQRPGTAKGRNADADAQIASLEKQLERSGSVKDATALLIARRSRQ